MRIILILFKLLITTALVAQFPPPAGQVGTTAIHKDSSIFVAWAANCEVFRGPQDISNPASALASAGEDWMATGKAGENGTVSFGDGGYAIVTFEQPIKNGDGWDFAIFENGFTDSFLELAFVEVSSDGINYVRFPATSLTQDTVQIDGFGLLDATKIDNLAGKYRIYYGTPFDLEELKNAPDLDINAITHIKIIDVVGSILPEYATYDQYGNKVNDPWPTPFPSSGFDLDAVGVINSTYTAVKEINSNFSVNVYPNPAKDFIRIKIGCHKQSVQKIAIYDVHGNRLFKKTNTNTGSSYRLDTSRLKAGIYFVEIQTHDTIHIKKLSIIR